MYIAVEGMDGVGKTSLAKKISTDLDINYIEKPMKKLLNMSEEEYNSLCNFMFALENKDIVMCFYMLGNIVTKHLEKNIIVDRNFLSSYYWDSTKENKDIFLYFIKKDVVPDLTIILYADPEIRLKRIRNRNHLDEDLNEKYVLNDEYDKMVEFAKEINLPYILINTNDLNFNEVVEICEGIIINLKKCPFLTKEICSFYNSIYSNKKLEKNQLKVLNLR